LLLLLLLLLPLPLSRPLPLPVPQPRRRPKSGLHEPRIRVCFRSCCAASQRRPASGP